MIILCQLRCYCPKKSLFFRHLESLLVDLLFVVETEDCLPAVSVLMSTCFTKTEFFFIIVFLFVYTYYFYYSFFILDISARLRKETLATEGTQEHKYISFYSFI